jgi:AcrR family transcriptional regulator
MAKKTTQRATGKTPAGKAAETPRDPDAAIIDAAMRLAADKGWRNVTLAAIAAECGVTLSEVYRRYPSRTAILAGLARRVDRQVLEGGGEPDAGESARDRLFDVMMRRFDAMKPYRQGVARVVEDLPRDPLTMACFGFQLRRSMAWMLEAAGIPSGGPAGLAKTKGLAAIHLCVLRTWLNDDSADLAKTMAAMDTALRRVAPVAAFLFGKRHNLG